MSKVVVVYRSKCGSAEKYARWIAEELQADLLGGKQLKMSELSAYDVIVYCGGIYVGGILGFSLIKKNYDDLKHKRIFVVAVGATLKKEEALEEIKKRNFTPEMNDRISLFLLRGGLDYKKMKWLDRLLMKLLVRSLKSKDPDTLDDESKGIIATYGKTVDFTNKNTIYPLIEAIRGE